MDELRCNSLRCRKSLTLEGTAVVTTCSHIFCLECANALFSVPQICPACETALPDLDDVVQATLSPHDSYKTSILSGLAPPVILDIASRALNFYTYQVQQEAAFQALITKNAQERIAVLEAQCNTIAREATAEISLLKDRVSNAGKDLEIERRRVRDLQETHKANAKAYSKLKAQYDKSKQRALLNPGDPTFSRTFSAALAPSPAATRQAFVPAQGDAMPGRASSSASIRQNNMNGDAGTGTYTGPFAYAQTKSRGAGSASRARRPLHEQNMNAHWSGDGEYGGGMAGGGQVHFGGGGKNSQSAMSRNHGQLQAQAQNGTPTTYFGQQVPNVAAFGPASESANRGGFRPASFSHGQNG
ncbi:hypothetical protein JCM5296_003646 [Sporobolomyces johnsonii]